MTLVNCAANGGKKCTKSSAKSATQAGRSMTQSGVGMIEILVSLVVVGSASLALLDVQIAALRFQKSAHQRLLSARFSADLADRVLANMGAADDGAYHLSQQVYPVLDPAIPSCINSGICSAADLAAADIHEWRTRLSQSLSGGWGEISGSVAQGFTVRVYFKAVDGHCESDSIDTVAHPHVHCIATQFFP